MKKRKTFSKILASCASIAVLVGSLSLNVLAAQTQYVGYDNPRDGFNVFGLDSDGNMLQTTYNNRGYQTYISVNGQEQDEVCADDDTFEYDTEYATGDITTSISAAFDSTEKAVLITYTVHNNGSDSADIRLGSCADCMIGNADDAPVRANGNGLSMTDGTNYFYLIPGNGNFTTTWSGRYGSRYDNVFTNSESHEYSGDSGLAWSWSFSVPAGGSVSKMAILAAGADLTTYTLSFDANGGEGTMDATSYITGLASSIPSNRFTRENYEFAGWATSADSSEVAYSNQAQITLTEDTTLYAVWNPIITNATFGEEPEAAEDLEYTGEPQELALPGSSNDGTVVYSLSEDGPFTSEIPTATASGTYTVYYKVEGDDLHEDTAVQSFEVTIGSTTTTVTVNGTESQVDAEATLTRPTDPTRAGYDFGGWYTDADCQNEYTFGSPVGVNGVTLYPKWIPFSYELTGGGSSEWTTESNDGLAFRAERTNNGAATFSHFTGVRVDNNTLGEGNYSAESGSVIVTLKPDYLKTLAVGEHTLEIMFDDGNSVTTTFTIKLASSIVSTGETETLITTAIGSVMVIVAAAMVSITLTKRIREERK